MLKRLLLRFLQRNSFNVVAWQIGQMQVRHSRKY